jgi:excisionase family DNA binding protein
MIGGVVQQSRRCALVNLDGVVSVNQAAAVLHVSPEHVRDLVKGGRLRAIKPGRELLIDVDSLHHRSRVIRPAAGRPLSPRMAWALLGAVGSEPPAWLNAVERGRVRAHLHNGRAC